MVWRSGWLRFGGVVMCLLGLVACVQHTMYTKPNIELVQLERDTERCKELAQTVQHNPGGPIPFNVVQGVGYLIGSAISGGVEDSEHARLTGQCLEMRGYLRRDITEDDKAHFEELADEEQKLKFLRALALKDPSAAVKSNTAN